MTQPLAQAVQGAVGQPATVRVGTIAGVNPVVLSVQGASFQGSAVGILGSYVPAVGDTVSVVGQCSTTGSDPTSWLILGEPRPADTQAGLVTTDVRMATATAVLNLTAVQTAVTGTTVNFTTTRQNAVVKLEWVVDFEAIGATQTTGVCFIVVDGVSGPSQALWEMPTAAAAGRVTAAQTDLQTVLTPGAHTARLEGSRAGGADNQIRINNLHTTLIVTVYE